MTRTTASLLLALLLAGCAGQSRRDGPVPGESTRDAYARRAEALQAAPGWNLVARLGVEAGEEGGSGRLDWSVQESASELSFRGTLGRGAWTLDLDGEGATLRLADGSVIHDVSVEDLISRETGLQIPVEALHWWVRGMASPDSEHLLDLDEFGLPIEISQDGWIIRYEKYMEHAGLMLPRRLEASREDYNVKLAVSRWQLLSGVDGA